jgi:hypothetical protein
MLAALDSLMMKGHQQTYKAITLLLVGGATL